MNMSSQGSLLGSSIEELLTKIIKNAVAESFQRHADETPRYPEKVAIDQASEITGYTKSSLYQMHSRGQVPGALKVGGKLLFDTATLKLWVEEGGRKIHEQVKQ